ncbi:Csu type fimbrial protein [Diaphorobacter caeni]|uniref:Csu type fimbrial protein n=1 Tax=Diaphorobacter caeni TaxID=2784387 RepID=UPI0018904632|nr:spore coat U domain-containing protein [Diaphorobacter caeni]MBF5004655.1 spore coat protein U domain-containing protein [Diaphorobacter caeni]
MLNFKQLGAASAVALGLVFSATAATTDTTDFKVKITITESCKFTGAKATDVDFGTTARSVDAADASGSLLVTCTKGTPFKIGLNNGLNASGSQRNMKHSTTSDTIPYGLFTNTGRTTAWGDLSTTPFSGTGTAAEVSIPVYGRVPTGATNVPAGAYEDTVTATISY